MMQGPPGPCRIIPPTDRQGAVAMIKFSIADFVEANPGGGIMLLPEKTSCVIHITLRFHPDGRWNIDQFASDMEREVQKKMGLSIDFRSALKRTAFFGSRFKGEL